MIHSCFNTSNTETKTAKIHVPLAAKCSMGCYYCIYFNDNNINCNSICPGTTSKLVTGYNEIYEYLKNAFIKFPETTIIGISGPGDSMENYDQIYILMDILKNDYPKTKLYICSNGRFFNQVGLKIINSGLLNYMTITINSLSQTNISFNFK